MPAQLTYPGVYIQEIPSGVRTISGVATSITAFIGRTLRGPIDRPVRVQSFAEFTRVFGGLWKESTLSYAVSQFFQHGGSDALIVRVFNGDTKACTATLTLSTATGALVLEAANPGLWGKALRATVDYKTSDDKSLFNLTLEELDRTGTQAVATETFRNLSVSELNPRPLKLVLQEESSLVRVRTAGPAGERPSETDPSNPLTAMCADQADGGEIEDKDIRFDPKDPNKRIGLRLLDDADLFNLLCIPPLAPSKDVDDDTWALAAQYCRERRAVLIVDPKASWTAKADSAIEEAKTGVGTLRRLIGNDDARNAAAYFPRLRVADPLSENRLADFAPCGAVAGIIARTDAQRGVWKAPAGLDASFSGVRGFTFTMTDAQNGVLNPEGLNCLRSFPTAGNVVWGARTLAGADLLASEWKYLPVRRLAMFLEESLYRGTQWVVFEPNDEPLWSQIRLNVGAFMHTLFRQGAFQGVSARDAYFVKCDRETTTQNDINLGIVNILVGFAPLKPAEFVVIKIQQMAGQVQA